MELCEGGELFDKLHRRGRFTEGNAAKIMFQLLSAVAYCHDRKVIHRDLKPENILLVEQGESFYIKVADFGCSAFFDVNRKLSGLFGSVYYIAPEVLKN
jgi:calcium-dependent protein kinase